MLKRINWSVAMPCVVLGAVLLFGSCSQKSEQKLIPPGDLMADAVHFQYAVYYLPVPSQDPVAVLKDIIKKDKLDLKVVKELPDDPTGMLVRARVEKNVQESYAPLDMRSLKYFGRGISKAQALKLQKSKQALILDFLHPKESVLEALKQANKLTMMVAEKTGGLLWDEETREVFSVAKWKEKRVSRWQEHYPVVSDHVTIHVYKSGDFVRAITLGMGKFGIPDVVADEFSWATERGMGSLMCLTCQSLVEQPVLDENGTYDIDIRSIKDKETREKTVKAMAKDAEPVINLLLREGVWEKGDPQNRLVEIGFDKYPGPDVQAKQQALLTTLVDAEDSVTNVKHDDELRAASEKARSKLPVLAKDFAAGLEPGEYIQVKIPFDCPDGGHEYMWVEITTWKGNKIKGLLRNEPFRIPSLHAGQVVEVKQEDVFDYIRSQPDGTQEGNTTGEIIAKMQAGK